MADKALILHIVEIVWGKSLSKLGSTIAVLGALSLTGSAQYIIEATTRYLGAPVDIPDTPPWVGFGLVLIGIATSGLSYVLPTTRASEPANPHDVELMARFRALVTNNVIDFLANHTFGTPWRRDSLDAIAEIAEGWKGARFEFQNSDLNAALARVKASANRLEELIAYGSWPMHNSPAMQTAKTDEDYKIGTQKATLDKIAQMDRLARELVVAINDLERAAQRLLLV